jgi:hypothetical protein
MCRMVASKWTIFPQNRLSRSSYCAYSPMRAVSSTHYSIVLQIAAKYYVSPVRPWALGGSLLVSPISTVVAACWAAIQSIRPLTLSLFLSNSAGDNIDTGCCLTAHT